MSWEPKQRKKKKKKKLQELSSFLRFPSFVLEPASLRIRVAGLAPAQNVVCGPCLCRLWALTFRHGHYNSKSAGGGGGGGFLGIEMLQPQRVIRIQNHSKEPNSIQTLQLTAQAQDGMTV